MMIHGTGLQKRFRGADGQPVAALSNVDFRIERGEFYVLLGPSGSGKTTTLRAVAGLEHPDAGEIVMDGKPVFDGRRKLRVPPEQRPIAMVFQSYALWPHMSVHENIAFPLRHGVRGIDRAAVDGRVTHAAELLSLESYLRRPISQLSGGQQQRVALARAIALQPSVLLMDEPLSNLDARLRARLRVELKALTRSIGMTTVYVTHDQTEAMVMADRIAVMASGCMRQEGDPTALYRRPRDRFVASFLGDMNFLRGRLRAPSGRDVAVDVGSRTMHAVAPEVLPAPGSAVSLGFRPEDAVLHDDALDRHGIDAVVRASHYLGDACLVELDADGQRLRVRVPKNVRPAPGSRLFVEVAPDHCLIFEPLPEETPA